VVTMDEISELWEELKFELGSVGIETLPKDKQEIYIGMGNRNADVLFIGNDPKLYLSEDYKVEAQSSGEFLIRLFDLAGIVPEVYYITTLSKREIKIKLTNNQEIIVFNLNGEETLHILENFKERLISSAFEDTITCTGVPRCRLAITSSKSAFDTILKTFDTNDATLKKEFLNQKIGYSDHSIGYEVPIAAATLGAEIIEKHFTLDNDMPGPDHKASATPDILERLVKGVRIVETSLGKYEKEPVEVEIKNKIVARKSIIAKKAIKKGEVFTEENITTKRPGNGISPMNWYDILGKVSEYDFEEDMLIKHSEFKNQE